MLRSRKDLICDVERLAHSGVSFGGLNRWRSYCSEWFISILYYPGKVNVVTDALNKLSMNNVIHVEEEKGYNL